MLTSVSQRFQTQIRTKTKKSYTSLSSITNHIDSPGIESRKTLLKNRARLKHTGKHLDKETKQKKKCKCQKQKKRKINRKQLKVLTKKVTMVVKNSIKA